MADNELMADIKHYGEDMYINPVDEYVGNRLRLKMMQKHMCHADFGISKEMLDDYINGSQRIGSAKLFEISMALDVPVIYFFEGFEPPYDMETNLKGHASPQLLLSGFYRAEINKRLKVMKLLKI